MVRRGGRDVPIPSLPLTLEISSMDLIARLRTSRSRSHFGRALIPLDRNGHRCFRFVFRLVLGTDNWARVSPRNRAGSRAIEEREKRDREAG